MTQQQMYEQIAETVDEWTHQERMFTFWYLIQFVQKFINEQKPTQVNTTRDAMLTRKVVQHNRALKEIKEVLEYEIF